MANSIKIRAEIKNDVCEVKTLIKHPMDTGLSKDKKTGKVIPAHHITELNCTHNGKEVMSAVWGGAISSNPYLSFRFTGAKAGDKVKLSWVDNLGETDSAEAVVK